MTPAQHEKWLRKMGVHPEQLKAKKKSKKLYKPQKTVKGYYEDKPLTGNSPLREPEKPVKVLSPLQVKILEENRTSPRDLGGDRDFSWS